MAREAAVREERKGVRQVQNAKCGIGKVWVFVRDGSNIGRA
jgi:hypothetical protein